MSKRDKKTAKRRVVQVLALVLALLLAGGAVVTALFSAWAETEVPRNDSCAMTIELYEEEQALRVTQRLVYTNRTGAPLDGVMFYLYGNMFRRESALIYESEDLDAVFPSGYAPGGVAFTAIRVNGEPATWGVQGKDELFLRVACDLQPGAQVEFEFEFVALYTVNNAMLGAGETDLRFSGFYPVPALTGSDGGFVTNAPLAFARTMFTPALDYSVDFILPEIYDLACGGTPELTGSGDGLQHWHVELTAHEFAFACGRRWRSYTAETASGVRVTVLSNARGAARKALACAVATIEQYENWFGPFPGAALTIAQSDYPLEGLTFDGLIWLANDLFAGNEEALAQQLRFRIAQQYFGLAAYVDPAADAWLTDSVSRYVAYLALEAADGPDSLLGALNRDIVPALQLTMPGGLNVTSAANLFRRSEYRVVVLDRGAAVLHELRSAMGREDLLAGLRGFCEMGADREALGEYDLVAALDAASGGSWEAFLTDWLFNISDYANQSIDWLD